jgi:hypothetical protein
MFGFKPKQPVAPESGLRDALFADAPLSQFVNLSPQALSCEPGASLGRAQRSLDQGDSKSAIQILHQIQATPQMESRVRLQAWHVLRELGVEPTSEEAKQVLGVVVEVGMRKGTDLVAGYADHRARYWNFSGAGIVWERPNDSLDGLIDDLLKKGSSVVQRIGPWKEPRPAAPPNGVARLNFLTPSGLHFGQGPINAIAADQMGGPVLSSAFQLMKAMTALGRQGASRR